MEHNFQVEAFRPSLRSKSRYVLFWQYIGLIPKLLQTVRTDVAQHNTKRAPASQSCSSEKTARVFNLHDNKPLYIFNDNSRNMPNLLTFNLHRPRQFCLGPRTNSNVTTHIYRFACGVQLYIEYRETWITNNSCEQHSLRPGCSNPGGRSITCARAVSTHRRDVGWLWCKNPGSWHSKQGAWKGETGQSDLSQIF